MSADTQPTSRPPNTQGNVALVVTGLDATGSMFRETAEIIVLDGWACAFQSKRQLDIDGALILEFRDSQGRRSSTSGRVIVCHNDPHGGAFRVGAQLEIAQSIVVKPSRIADRGPQLVAPVLPSPHQHSETGASAADNKSAHAIPTQDQPSEAASEQPLQASAAPANDTHRPLSETDRQHLQHEIEATVLAQLRDSCTETLKSMLPEIVKSVAGAFSSETEKIVRQAAQQEIAAQTRDTVDTAGEELRASMAMFMTSLVNTNREQFQQDIEDTVLRPAEEIEKRLIAQIHSAEESFKALSAALTLVRATLQQSEQIAQEHSRSVGIACEKGIRAMLLRLAEGHRPA